MIKILQSQCGWLKIQKFFVCPETGNEACWLIGGSFGCCKNSLIFQSETWLTNVTNKSIKLPKGPQHNQPQTNTLIPRVLRAAIVCPKIPDISRRASNLDKRWWCSVPSWNRSGDRLASVRARSNWTDLDQCRAAAHRLNEAVQCN